MCSKKTPQRGGAKKTYFTLRRDIGAYVAEPQMRQAKVTSSQARKHRGGLSDFCHAQRD